MPHFTNFILQYIYLLSKCKEEKNYTRLDNHYGFLWKVRNTEFGLLRYIILLNFTKIYNTANLLYEQFF